MLGPPPKPEAPTSEAGRAAPKQEQEPAAPEHAAPSHGEAAHGHAPAETKQAGGAAESEVAPAEPGAADAPATPPPVHESGPPAGQVRVPPVPATVSVDVHPIAPPDPALMEDSPHYNDVSLPKIGADGRMAMKVYAAEAYATPGQPRIGLLIDGIGLSQGDSRDAITNLPAAVSLAVSAYAPHPDALLEAARAAGHEYLISIPMEPEGFPLNDEGFRALLTSADPPVNQRNLEWILSRFNGYIGGTSGSDGLNGERFAQSGQGFAEMGDELARRGLLFIDARVGATLQPDLAGRSIDLLLDEPPTALDIDQKLAQLETLARNRGSAVGLAGPPRPVLLERIVGWSRGLAERGISLVPVSALSAPAKEKPPPPTPPEEVKAGEAPAAEGKPAEGKKPAPEEKKATPEEK